MPNSIASRMTQRIRQAREQAISEIMGRNQEVKDNLDKALPELRRTLKSRPDLLRLIMELYSYVESEGESLSQATENVALARQASGRAAEASVDMQIDMASLETYLNAIEIYIQAEVPTQKRILTLFDLAPLEQSLSELKAENGRRFEELRGVFEKVAGGS